jgi:hypothetical protein
VYICGRGGTGKVEMRWNLVSKTRDVRWPIAGHMLVKHTY